MKSNKKGRKGVRDTVDNKHAGRDKSISSRRSAGTTELLKKLKREKQTPKQKAAMKVYKNGYAKGGLVAFRIDGSSNSNNKSDEPVSAAQMNQTMNDRLLIMPNRIVTKDSDAATRRAVFDKFHANKKDFIKAEEFAGEGKIIQILKYENTEAHGDFQPGIQFTCREPETGQERLWTTSSTRAIEAVEPYVERGVDMIRVYKTGTNKNNTYYFAEEVNDGHSSKSSTTAAATPKKRKKKSVTTTTAGKKKNLIRV
jgi:hypothetical protein